MIPPHVLPWARCDPGRLLAVRGVLTDIDDTLTSEGMIPLGVVAALSALRAAGLPVIAVTGRPLGWSRPIAETVPLAAIVAENGAVALIPEQRTAGADARAKQSADAPTMSALIVEFADDAVTRDRNAKRLDAVAARIVAEVPGAGLSRDSAGRVTDIAIDHAEFAHLDAVSIARVVALMHGEGMSASVSSIHVNGWFGTHSKLSGADWIVRRLFGHDLAAERDAWLYVGDSSNDELMFANFPLSVGVANIVDFADALRQWPAYVTALDRGRGFVEIAEALLAARRR